MNTAKDIVEYIDSLKSGPDAIIAPDGSPFELDKNIFYNFEPSEKDVDINIVSVFTDGGGSQYGTVAVDTLTAKFRARGETDEFPSKALQTLKLKFQSGEEFTINGTRYIGFTISSSPGHRGFNKNDRYIWTMTFDILIEPLDKGFRQ